MGYQVIAERYLQLQVSREVALAPQCLGIIRGQATLYPSGRPSSNKDHSEALIKKYSIVPCLEHRFDRPKRGHVLSVHSLPNPGHWGSKLTSDHQLPKLPLPPMDWVHHRHTKTPLP